MFLSRSLTLAAVALGLTAAAHAQAPRLLGAQSDALSGTPPRLVEIDASSAAGTSLGAIGAEVRALAAAPSGLLYAVDNTATRLVVLDPTTGAIQSVVGSLNGRTMTGLAAHPTTGELWGFTVQGSALVRLDPTNAAMTVVAVAPIGMPSGLTWTSDGSALYAVDSVIGALYSLNPISGAATLIGVGGAGSNGGPLGIATHPVTGALYVAEDRGGADMTLATVSTLDGSRTNVGTMAGFDSIEGLTFYRSVNVGTNYCGPAVSNSTGSPASIAAIGSNLVSQNVLALEGAGLPMNSFAFFLVSRDPGFTVGPGGSAGNLCLGGSIGRYVGPGQIQQAGQAGTVALGLDLAQIPQPQGFVGAAPGDTWRFQGWYRDAAGGQPTSNFTDGVSVTFQ